MTLEEIVTGLKKKGKLSKALTTKLIEVAVAADKLVLNFDTNPDWCVCCNFNEKLLEGITKALNELEKG